MQHLIEPLAFANGVLSVLAALALSWVVLNPRIRDGLLIKTGLVISIFALAASAWLSFAGQANAQALFNSGFALRLGIVITCVGVAWSQRKRGGKS